MLEKLRKYVLMIQNFKPYILIAFKRLKIQNPITVHVMADMITALEGGGVGGGGDCYFLPEKSCEKIFSWNFPEFISNSKSRTYHRIKISSFTFRGEVSFKWLHLYFIQLFMCIAVFVFLSLSDRKMSFSLLKFTY